MVKRKCELAIDKEKDGSHSIENPPFQYMYHFIRFYKCIFVFAAVGSESYRKLKFPFHQNSLHVFGALRTFRAGWLWCSCLLCWTRKVPRYHERCRPTAILLTNILSAALGPFCDFQCKKLSCAEGLPGHCWQKMSTFSCCKSCMKQFLPPPKRMNDDAIQVKTLQNGFGKKAVDAEFLTR